MSDMFPGPSGDPRYPQQPLLPHPAYGHDAPLGGFRLGRALGLLVILLLLLLVPNFVEEVRFAWTRGKERAEAEIARQVLDEGRGPTIGQYRTVVKAVQSSVVGVKATRAAGGRDLDDLALLFGRGVLREQDQGSGVIIDPAGYIVTNYHVVGQAKEVHVELSDGETHEATIVGADPTTDLAVLKISAAKLRARRGAKAPIWKWAIRSWRSAVPSDWTGLSPPASSVLRGETRSSTRFTTMTSCRPTPRSIPATAAARWSTCAAR